MTHAKYSSISNVFLSSKADIFLLVLDWDQTEKQTKKRRKRRITDIDWSIMQQ